MPLMAERAAHQRPGRAALVALPGRRMAAQELRAPAEGADIAMAFLLAGRAGRAAMASSSLMGFMAQEVGGALEVDLAQAPARSAEMAGSMAGPAGALGIEVPLAVMVGRALSS